MASLQQPSGGLAPHPTPPYTPSNRSVAGPSTPRSARHPIFTEHLDDDNPANSFEYSETRKSTRESETISVARTASPNAGPASPYSTVVRRTSTRESRQIRRSGSVGSRRSIISQLEQPPPPSQLPPYTDAMPQPSTTPTPSGMPINGQGPGHETDEPNSVPLGHLPATRTPSPRHAFEVERAPCPYDGEPPSSQSRQPPPNDNGEGPSSQCRQCPERLPPRRLLPGASIPNITLSAPYEAPIALTTLESLAAGEAVVRHSPVTGSRQTVRAVANPDGTLRRQVSFSRGDDPPVKWGSSSGGIQPENNSGIQPDTSSGPSSSSAGPPSSSSAGPSSASAAAPTDPVEGALADVDTNGDTNRDDADKESVYDLAVRAEQTRQRAAERRETPPIPGVVAPRRDNANPNPNPDVNAYLDNNNGGFPPSPKINDNPPPPPPPPLAQNGEAPPVSPGRTGRPKHWWRGDKGWHLFKRLFKRLSRGRPESSHDIELAWAQGSGPGGGLNDAIPPSGRGGFLKRMSWGKK